MTDQLNGMSGKYMNGIAMRIPVMDRRAGQSRMVRMTDRVAAQEDMTMFLVFCIQRGTL